MKKLVALPLAVLFAAACSESTAPSSTATNLTPSYGKPVSPPPPATCCTVLTADNFYDFGTGISATGTGGSHIGTDSPIGVTTEDAPLANIQTSPAPSHQQFLGRFNNTQTRALLVLDNGGSKFELKYDLYTIGSWDGKGKQAQSGYFLANVFSVTAVCAGNVSHILFASTFSNQLTVQQDFPANVALGQSGGNKAASGAYDTDALSYAGHPELSNTPPFRSFGDVSYHMSLSGANPCGNGNAVTFAFSSTAPGQQNNNDESWGIDNVSIKAGT